jgi:hypothetical protein
MTDTLDRLEALASAVLTAYLETGEAPAFDVDGAREELALLLDRHRDVLAGAGVGFAFDLARALAQGPNALDELDLEGFTDAELAALAEAGADRVEALVEGTVARRAALVTDLKALAYKASRGALSAALMAALAA